jgi:hypothetical protein
MSLYDAKSSSDFYKIIKPYYIHNKKQFDANVPTILRIQHNDKRLNILTNYLQQRNDNSFLDFSFVKHYLSNCKYYYHIKYQRLQCFIISAKPLIAKDKHKLYNTIIRIATVMQVYNMDKPMNFYLIMDPRKRQLPSDGPFNAEHINGGFTYLSSNNIVIIRKEEYEKVVIHELLHHNRYIHNDNYTRFNIKRLKHKFNIDERCILNSNEAVIEVFACMLNTVFYALDGNKNIMYFKKLLRDDCHHSHVISKKILDIQKNNKWFEKTNAYSYCIFKTILYKHFDKFIKDFQYDNNDRITDFLCNQAGNLFYSAMRKHYNDKMLKLTIF